MGNCFGSTFFLFKKTSIWCKGDSSFNDIDYDSINACLWPPHVYNVDEPLLTQSFMTLTMTISIPSTVFFFNWLGTIWRGSIRFDSPMLFSLGVVFVFGLGGLTGLYLGTVTTDLYLHDTYFVVGHFHYTMAASVLLGGFAGIYFWMPKMFGVMMNEVIAKVHFWITMLGLNGVFMGMLLVGHAGMHRRLYNPFWYEFIQKRFQLIRLSRTPLY